MKCNFRNTMILIAFALLASPVTLAGGHKSKPPKQHHSTPSTTHTPQPSNTSTATSLAASQSNSAASSSADSQNTVVSDSFSNAQGGRSQSRSNATGGQSSAAGGSVNSTITSSPNASVSGTIAPVIDASSETGVTVEGDTFEAARIPVATAIAGSTNTTAGCRYSVGAGGQAPVIGLAVTVGRKDDDCERYELAQFFYARGQAIAGDRIICQIRTIKAALGDDCLKLVHQTTDVRVIKRQEFERINK